MNNHHSKIQSYKPALSGVIIGIIVLIIAAYLTYSQYRTQEQNEQAETRETLELIEQSFQYAIREVNSIALLLTQSVDQNGNVINFDSSAISLIEKYPSINVLELIDNGIVTHIYPSEGYENVLGYDLYQNERIRLELLRSAENNDIYFSGPITLVEGGLGVIGLLPFDKDGDKFKISAVILQLDTFLSQTQMPTFSDRYYFQFSKINLATGEEEFFIENEIDHDHPIDWPQEQFVEIPEGDWKLYAHLISSDEIPADIFLLAIFSILLSTLIGYLSFRLFAKPIELEQLLQERTIELFDSREQFKKSSELLGSVLASPQNIVIFSVDSNFNYIAYNENYKSTILEYYNVNVRQGNSALKSYPSISALKLEENLLKAINGESFEITHIATSNSGCVSYWENWFSPIMNKDGAIIGVTVYSVDITKRVKAEREKTTLLTEIHHRVKNNLAIVSGLLQLQKVETNDDRLTAIFDQSINRIISIALVHELMYNNDDLSSVDINAYLEKLIPAINETMQNNAQNVQFKLDIEEYDLNINEAIPIGLLLNELITNSFKYAFDESINNTIEVSLKSKNDRVYVTYFENGTGYPVENFEKPKSLGLNLVHAQLTQLEASYEVDTENKFKLDFSFTSQGKGSHSHF